MSGPADPISAALDNPTLVPALVEPGATGPELGAGDRQERPPFPPGSPVMPLGVASSLSGSQLCYYLNASGQIVGLEAGNRHGKNSLIHLYGAQSDWLEANFAQCSKPVYEGRGNNRVLVREAEIVGFDQAEASRAMIEECSRRGIFDPAGKIRGSGAHRQRGGGLVLHCGDRMLVSRHYTLDGAVKDWLWLAPGPHEGLVYTAGAKLPRPHHEAAHAQCAEQIMRLLMTWHWKRPLLDPRFFLGAIGASMVGGALRWRPNIWITGGRGTGKSTLNGEDGVLAEVFGEGQLRTGNASSAAIRQTLQNSTVPVVFDEIEASADNRRVTEVIELARIASSGAKMHRGGQDHQAVEFTLRSVFWFSSINIPPLQPQDRSRLAILELKPIAKGSKPPDLAAMNLPKLAQALMRRMVDGWGRLEATKNKFHAALSAQGHDNRACDQFGTLLACADVLLWDHTTHDGLPDDEEVGRWALECRPDRLAEINDETPDHIEALQHVLTTEVQARGSEDKVSLASWIGSALNYAIPHLLGGDDKADRRLQEMGIKLVNARWIPGDAEKSGKWGTVMFNSAEPGFLAIANSHRQLDKNFTGTKWQGGVWKQSLARFEGALSGVTVKLGHVSSRAVLVPLWQVLDEGDLPPASKRAGFEEWRRALAAEAGG